MNFIVVLLKRFEEEKVATNSFVEGIMGSGFFYACKLEGGGGSFLGKNNVINLSLNFDFEKVKLKCIALFAKKCLF